VLRLRRPTFINTMSKPKTNSEDSKLVADTSTPETAEKGKLQRKKPAGSKKTAPKIDAKKRLAELAGEEDPRLSELKSRLQQDGEWQEFIVLQKARLLDLRDQLLDAMENIQRDSLSNHPEGSEASGSGEHTADAGSDAYDREMALAMLSKEQDALYEVEEALERIRRNVYGICEMSSTQIPRIRLEALPFARLTIECQTQLENEQGQMSRGYHKSSFGFTNGVIEQENSSNSLDEEEE